MKIHYSVRHLKLTTAIRDYVDDKIGTMDRLDDLALGAHVVLYHDETKGAKPFCVKAHIAIPGNDIHAETHDKDLYAAIDLVVDKIAAQMRKHKGKIVAKQAKVAAKIKRTVRGS